MTNDKTREDFEAGRPCTCHPDDNPPVPCAKKYALDECRAQQAEAVPSDVDVVRKALDRAFVLGQNYWADADSESVRAHKRSDVTRANFLAMRDDVCAALAAAPKGQP